MKKQISQFLIAAMLTSSLSACESQQFSTPAIDKQDAGTILGGATGALLGAQFGKGNGQIVSVAAGTLLGAYLGNSIGKSLDQADLQAYNNSSQTALERNRVGQASSWNNPDTGHSGTVTPTRTYTQNGTNCREYQQTITVGGKTEKAYGTACRQADGTWKIVQ